VGFKGLMSGSGWELSGHMRSKSHSGSMKEKVRLQNEEMNRKIEEVERKLSEKNLLPKKIGAESEIACEDLGKVNACESDGVMIEIYLCSISELNLSRSHCIFIGFKVNVLCVIYDMCWDLLGGIVQFH